MIRSSIKAANLPSVSPGIINREGSTAFSPADLSPYFWFEAGDSMLDSGGSAASEGEEMATWSDLSSNSRDAVQDTVGNRPLAYPDGDGKGHPHFRCLRTGTKHIDLAFGTSFTSIKILMVFTIIGTPSNGGRLISMGSGSSDTNAQSYIPAYYTGGNLQAYASAGQLTHVGGGSAGAKLLECHVDDGDQRSRLNRGTELTGSVTLDQLDLQRLSVGSQHNNNSNGIDMDVRFLIGLPTSITEDEESDLLDYINANYGV